jgi:hypothetical protein
MEDHAEMTTTADRPPLWEVLRRAYDTSPMAPMDADDDWTDRHGYAAEILALRDWLKSELPEGGAWHVLLTAEADRAERGDD